MSYAIEGQKLSNTGSFPVLNDLPIYSLLSKPSTIKKPQYVDSSIKNCRNSSELLVTQHPLDSEGRKELETFIQSVFFDTHKALLNAYLPELFSAKNKDKKIVAAIGLRTFESSPIFLEKYLENPVDVSVSELAEKLVSRKKIVEVGNLASTCAGSSRLLIAFLINYLANNDLEWAVCTGTNAVRAVLKRMGVEFQLIKKADPEALGEDQYHWGSYYQHNPFVLAVNVPQALKITQQKYRFQE